MQNYVYRAQITEPFRDKNELTRVKLTKQNNDKVKLSWRLFCISLRTKLLKHFNYSTIFSSPKIHFD